MKKLWHMLLSGFGAFLITAAKPLGVDIGQDLWQHVNKTCLIHACDEAVNVEHLSQLQRYMRSEANPCENFHEYACGNWQREHQNETTMMKYADNKLTAKYVEIFEQLSRGEVGGAVEAEENLIFAKMLKYYHSCTAIPKFTLRGYFEEMREHGLWHLHHYNWIVTLAELGRYGYADHFLRMTVKQNNASEHRITVQPHNELENVQLNAEIYELLREYTSKDYAMLQSDFHKLEMDLMEIVNGSTNDEDFELYTFRELVQKSQEIDWQQFLGRQMGRQMRDEDVIAIDSLINVKTLAQYLNQSDKDLMFLYTLARFCNYLQNQQHRIFDVVQTAPTDDSDRIRRCIRHMRKTFHIPMTYVYERLVYSSVREASDRVIHAVFHQLKAGFALTLTQNRMQLSDSALEFLQAKLLSLHLNLGNMPHNVTEQFYTDYVSNLNVTRNFYYNHLHALQHHYAHKRFLAELHPADAASPWHTFQHHSPDFPDNIDWTPYYYCLSNLIVVPHAYLQTPFYDQRFWPVLLYGDLATTLGHELIHAFDNYFLQYDQLGNMSDAYKSIVSNENYKRNIDCLNTSTEFLTERIADISGTRLTLNTFLRDPLFRQRNGKLFFLQFAQFFCGSPDLSTFEKDDPYHDLDSLRLNYTLAHMPEFAELFGCPAGSAMNPVQRCEMW